MNPGEHDDASRRSRVDYGDLLYVSISYIMY